MGGFLMGARVLLRCWPSIPLKPNAGVALTHFLMTVLDTLQVFATVCFPVLQFEAVKNWLMATRNVPKADNQFHEMTARYRTLSTPAAVL